MTLAMMVGMLVFGAIAGAAGSSLESVRQVRVRAADTSVPVLAARAIELEREFTASSG